MKNSYQYKSILFFEKEGELRIQINGKGEYSLDNMTFISNEVDIELLEGIGTFFLGMPTYNDKTASLPLPKPFLNKRYSTDDMAFFGGTFFPWHEGHSACLEKCGDKNIMVVIDKNPLKEDIDRGPIFQRAYEIAKKSIKDNISTYPSFLALATTNPTVDWVGKTSFDSKALLIGDDSFLSLFMWKNYELLLRELNNLYVTPRLVEESVLLEQKNAILEISSELEITFLGHHEYEDLSSTSIRS